MLRVEPNDEFRGYKRLTRAHSLVYCQTEKFLLAEKMVEKMR